MIEVTGTQWENLLRFLSGDAAKTATGADGTAWTGATFKAAFPSITKFHLSADLKVLCEVGDPVIYDSGDEVTLNLEAVQNICP